MLTLTVIQGPDKGKTFALPLNEPQLIGRSSEALPTTDTTVSRRHAELTPDDGEWYIRDLESQNGTYVNGVRIPERTRLRLGDQIRTGSTLWMFGRREGDDSRDVIRVVRPDQMDTQIERAIPSNDDSVIMAEPEPRTAAVHHLQVIYRLTALTAQTTAREELLAGVMELVFNEFKPERGFILLHDEPAPGQVAAPARPKGPPATPRPVVVKYRTPPKDKKDARIHVSRTILQHAMTGSEGVLSSNAMTDPRFAKGDSVQQFHIRSALCSPIEFGDRKFGAIYVDSSIANYTFTPEQLALLNAIARHTGLALANAEGFAKRLQTERLAAIGETVASLSHSIKNILQGLRGGADVVEMGLKKEDLKIARGGWAILKRNIDRIMGLTMNMLAYSARRTLEYELVKVGALIEDCAQLLHDLCTARGVALIIDADPEMPPVLLDPSLMHQALINLMGNAVEAVEPQTGAVTVRAAYLPAQGQARAMFRIDVIDNGPGIAAERHDSIFQPFQTSKGLRGTGLGLAVTKRIIEEHGGRVRLESSEGRGATFTIIMPADGARADPSATAASRSGNSADPDL
ncbi:MAG: FHA domain-containing protein [Phycisphaeraceae bacterium]|nr:FHA domain-containing protein [Phycisphaeraceae bacterium]MBX3407280.1 FHA domain-containing protein [Phycisphaeraceae bacterium]